MARLTPEQVVEAFMNQKPANGGIISTDGQSLFSFSTRIAEHIPKNGGACTVVYNYTYNGNAYKSPATSSHVGLAKQRIPYRNVIPITKAQKAGLVP